MTSTTYQCFFSYFGLRENPFHVSPDARFYHSTPAHDSAFNEIQYGLETKQGLMVLTGEAGIGKTTVVNNILETLAQRNISTAYVFHPLLEPMELFQFILRDFGVKSDSARKGDLLTSFHAWLIARNAAGDSPVVIIDEAHALSSQALDELRLFLNLETAHGKMLQIILVGQSELDDKLRQPELRQLRQRVMIHSRLPLFSEEQTIGYIYSRLSFAGCRSTELFPRETLQVIHEHSRGIPRLINLLCEHALITAYGEQQKIVSPAIIERIAVDFDLSERPISIENDYSASRYGRLITFPVIVEPRPAAPVKPVEREPEHERQRVQTMIDAALTAASSEPKKETAIPAAASVAPPSETRTFWRERRSHSRTRAVKQLRSASEGFAEYWQQVGDSFMRDVRYFFRPLTLSLAQSAPQTVPALKVEGTSPAGRNGNRPKSDRLRQPVTPGHIPAHGEPDRPATSK